MQVTVYAAHIPPDIAFLPLAAWVEGLPLPRRERVERLRFRQDVIRGAVTDRLLRLGLREAGLDASLNGWREEELGKPYLENLPGVHFSLSHSGDVALCALADAPVGADVERVRPLPDGVARRVLSPVELSLYLHQGKDAGLIIRLWTLKESYAKFTGEGLGVRLSEITFPTGLPPAQNLTGAAFALMELGEDYRGAVCGGGAMDLSVGWADIGKL